MKTLDFINLDANKTVLVVNGLQQLLADFQVYYSNLRNMHWNIKGHGFFVLHKQFESMYNDAAEKVDEIAERILTLGGVPESKFSHYLKVSQIKEAEVVSKSELAIANILDSLKYLMDAERGILKLAQDSSDEVTVSMLSDYLKEQEKLVWMLVAFKNVD